jgi:hypothetical protein
MPSFEISFGRQREHHLPYSYPFAICFAHLLGSDYTEGIPGIGPVTALEILTEFSSLEEEGGKKILDAFFRNFFRKAT